MIQSRKRYGRLAALLMAFVLILSMFAGCKLPDNFVTEPITIESDNTSEPTPAEVTPAPEPTFSYSEAAEEAFHALDLEVFRWYATLDGYSFHMFIDNPASFNIDHASVPMTSPCVM